METNSYLSFQELFDTDTTHIKSVCIPMIQRSYAQGRKTKMVAKTRKKFLDSIYNAVSQNKELNLDFVYGKIDNDNGVLTPLDGQQRLTTLFLLHWYAAQKENLPKSDFDFLSHFTYETRYSSRDFCTELVRYTPDLSKQISSEIEDQAWFPLGWLNDPTIASMLVMLDAIQERFNDVHALWHRLNNIRFSFLAIDTYGLTDDIYIKMNSRGKPLTRFEHWKAEFERLIEEKVPNRLKEIADYIDIDWTNLLWCYRGDNNIIDDEFIRYFHFICDVICYSENGTPNGNEPEDEFELLERYFQGENTLQHFDTVIAYFN